MLDCVCVDTKSFLTSSEGSSDDWQLDDNDSDDRHVVKCAKLSILISRTIVNYSNSNRAAAQRSLKYEGPATQMMKLEVKLCHVREKQKA